MWVKLANGQIEHIDTITGPLTTPMESFGHSNVQALTPRRLTMMEWATVGGVAGLTPRRYIVDDCWDTWTPSDPAEYAWHGHVLFFEDPVQHVPDGPMFVPTGLLPGQSEDHPDLAYYLNVWATCPSPLSGYESAHSAVFSGEWKCFWMLTICHLCHHQQLLMSLCNGLQDTALSSCRASSLPCVRPPKLSYPVF